MITKLDAILSLVPGAKIIMTDDQIEWVDPSSSPVTEEQIANEVERLSALEPLNACKEKAKQLIAATDWAMLPDVGLANQDAFVFYRLNLRNLIKNPVANPVFETEPTPIWS